MNHKDLDVWKKSMDLVVEVYDWTTLFPDEEKYGLISQMRRAAVSIPSNIAEGSARKSDKELLQFINIALGSVAELETQYLIVLRLKFSEPNTILNDLLIDVKQLLLGYRNYVRRKT
ncbi:four helix bundle protein [Meridianimaribacter flavus]|uniref:Four helix bundle protein n=1 Tax=Meridianimaribacter flavus TaxID=571115 RepID=A0ABY2G5R4_9FLAO|nr:four helix bundle protein [Meridianimaribacter flavus]TDY11766.1 four helix bundle protein [Meridianimaribacter flavus]